MPFLKTNFISVLLCVTDVAIQAAFFVVSRSDSALHRCVFVLGSVGVLVWMWVGRPTSDARCLFNVYGVVRFWYLCLLLYLFVPPEGEDTNNTESGLLLLGCLPIVLECAVILDHWSDTWIGLDTLIDQDSDQEEAKGTLSADVVDDYKADICSICFEDLSGPCARLQCGHVFHIQCADQWYQVQRSGKEGCALCRGE